MLNDWLRRILGRSKTPQFDAIPAEKRKPIEALISELREKHLTYVGATKLKNLAWAAIDIGERGIAGDFVEAGVALGGSAILLGRLKPASSGLLLFDVFGLIPPPGEQDGADAHSRFSVISSGKAEGLGGDQYQYYGYVDQLEETVRSNLAAYGITAVSHGLKTVRGLFQDTLELSGPVALAHIDCDWYESVSVCIARIFPHLAPGGLMIFDDYKSYSGCRRAVDEWLATEGMASVVFSNKSVGITRKF
ncbi:MAG: class I SAM-dependent methyltransferase [Rhizobiales bacterium]|nr:class I SAM-dependent methyltransferase [Hyphomicrobiales bacterium]MBI3673484.1 class I SAM-dependent methyltransferase [Hyphomicrobiales bacterium]